MVERVNREIKGPTRVIRGDFVASTLKISADTFMQSGSPLFQGSSSATVVNLGNIFSADGSIFLIGHTVENSGSLQASNGSAGLAAGSEVLLKDSTADQRVFVKAAGGDVTNTGAISAAQVELKAKGGNIYALAANNTGGIASTGTAEINGHVWLISDGGSTQVTGSVSAQNADGKGGQVETSGSTLAISNATVKTGRGGNWLLDPDDLTIDSTLANTIETSLNGGTNVTEQTSAPVSGGNGDITVANNIAWSGGANLTLSAYRNIGINNGITISNNGSGNLTLRADNTATGAGTVSFNGSGSVDFSQSTGNVAILYNPTGGFSSPTSYSSKVLTNGSWSAPADGTLTSQMTAYMLVNNSADLQNIDNNDAGTFALGKDIDLSSIPNFNPLGNSNAFSGVLDGQGHTISNLTQSSNQNEGLFATVTGQVQNLSLTNVNIAATGGNVAGAIAAYVGGTGIISNSSASGVITADPMSSQIGGLVGSLQWTGGTIQNSHASVTIDASTNTSGVNAGGLVGFAFPTTFIKNSYATGSVTAGDNALVGGLVGQNGGTIAGSYATGAVTGGNSSQAGGLAGASSGSISGSYATGAVTAGDSGDVGGLVGSNTAPITTSFAAGAVSGGQGSDAGGLIGYSQTGGTVSVSYATGAVTGNGMFSYVGGLVGDEEDSLTDTYARGSVNGTDNSSSTGGLVGYLGGSGSITRSYSSGHVQNNGLSDAGFVGFNSGTITSSYWDTQASGMATNAVGYGSSTGITGATTTSLQSGNLPTGFNVNNSVWAHPAGVYPYFGWQGALVQFAGSVFDGASPGPIAGANVSALSGGVLIGSTTTQNGGFFSMAAPSNMVHLGPGVLVYLTSGGTANFYSDYDPPAFTNIFMLTGALIEEAAYNLTQSSLTNGMSRAVGALSSSNFLFTTPGGQLSVTPGTNLYLAALPAFTMDQSPTGTGNVFVSANGGFTMASGQSLNAAANDNVIISAGPHFNNQAGPNALNVSGTGRFLVYSTDPAADNRGGLAYSFKQYDATYGSTAVAQGTGNGFLYTLAPVLTPSLIGTVAKVYDGTAAATTSSNLNATGAIDGDSVVLSASASSYSDKNAGTSKLVTASGLSASAANGSVNVYGYSLGSTSVNANVGVITPLTLTVGGTTVAANKTYDGTLTAVLSGGTIGGVIGSDAVIFAQAGTFADKNAGAGKTVTYSNSITGADSGNYVLSSTGGSLAASITPATLTVGGTTVAANKIYDGALGAAISGGTISGVVGGDTVAFAQAGTFADKNAGAGKTVTYGNSITGADSGNYVLSSVGGSLTANITPATLTVGGTTVAANKTYDGNLTAVLSGGTISGVIGGDAVSLAQSGSFTDKNTGTGKTVTYSNNLLGTDAGNYILSSTGGGSLLANITPATLTVGGTTIANKTYDGNLTAVLSGGTVSGIIGSDAVTFAQTGSFADKNAATGKTVTYSNSITGADSGNYVLSSSGGTLLATIAPVTLTVGGMTVAANKTYDGTLTAVLSGGTIGGVIGSDAVSFVQAGTFADKNAGAGKTVTYSNSITGADSGNYVLSSTGGSLAASITPATLTVGGTTVAANKIYDGTLTAVLSGGTIGGVIGSDAVTFAQAGTFADKNVGASKTVSYSNSITGADSDNYVLSSTGGSLAASITPATLTVGGTTVAANKTYDGALSAAISGGTIGGVIGSDAVSFAQAGTFADKNAGADKTVTYNNSITGADSGDYVLSSNGGTLLATIAPATLTVGGTTVAANKTYNGTVSASISGGTISGVVGSDTVAFAQSGTFADKNAGAGKTVTYGNSITGTDSGNYVLSSNGGTLLAIIAPATLTVGGTTVAASKTYDGALSAAISGGTISGVVGSDTVAFAQSGTFADKNAGAGKTVTYGNSITGADSGNYVLSSNGGTLLATITPATLLYVASTPGNGSSRPFGSSNPVLSGTVTGLVGGDTLASVTSGSATFTSNATVSSGAGLYAVTGGGLTLTTGNYTLSQAPGNWDAFTIQPITISIQNVYRTAGSPDPTFMVNYSGPTGDYLKSLLTGLTLVTNAPASDVPGTYQITALVPASLASSILVQPGTLTIGPSNSSLVGSSNSPQVAATLPASFQSQALAPPMPLPPVDGESSSADRLIPGNAISQFQVVITPQQSWSAGNARPADSTGDTLSHASFTETSPDGRSKGNKSTYAAGAKQ